MGAPQSLHLTSVGSLVLQLSRLPSIVLSLRLLYDTLYRWVLWWVLQDLLTIIHYFMPNYYFTRYLRQQLPKIVIVNCANSSLYKVKKISKMYVPSSIHFKYEIFTDNQLWSIYIIFIQSCVQTIFVVAILLLFCCKKAFSGFKDLQILCTQWKLLDKNVKILVICDTIFLLYSF